MGRNILSSERIILPSSLDPIPANIKFVMPPIPRDMQRKAEFREMFPREFVLKPDPKRTMAELPDNSPLVEGVKSGKKRSVFELLQYTAPRFRKDNEAFRKRKTSRLHVHEMLESEKWKTRRKQVRTGYEHMITPWTSWFEHGFRYSDRQVSVTEFMSDILEYRNAVLDKLIEYNKAHLKDGVYDDDEERTKKIAEKTSYKFKKNGYLASIIPSLAYTAAFQARRVFREGDQAAERTRLRFATRWCFFEIAMEESSGALIVVLGSRKKKFCVLSTDLLTQNSLPHLADLELSSGIKVDWQKDYSERIKLMFYAAKTRHIYTY